MISALFMAAFLFFLSVALVVTNREDIRYTLFTDHKMRSNFAADGMLDYALQYIRNTQQWEQSLPNEHPEFASGAYGSASAKPFVVPNAASSPRYSIPAVDFSSGPALELIAQASSGPFQSERHLLLEEFRLADSIANEGRKPHLFAVSDSGLQVLAPSFKWEGLGGFTGGTPVPQSFSACGQELRYCAEGDGVDPPQIKDFQKIALPNGPVLPGPFEASSKQIPKGQGLRMLVLNGDKFEWQLLPDPGEPVPDGLSSVAQAKVLGEGGLESLSEGGDPINKTWAELTLDWNVLAKSPSDLTVPYEYFNGPRINFYAVTGKVAVTDKNNAYYVHGTHYFYAGMRFKNTEQPGNQVLSQGKDATLYAEPCILKLKDKKWTPVLDLLKVEDLWTEPTVVPGPRPDPSTLLLNPESGEVFVKELGKDDPNWLRADAAGISSGGPRGTRDLFFYGQQMVDFAERPQNPEYQGRLYGLTVHDIGSSFPAYLPARNQNYPTGQANTATAEPERKLFWNVVPGKQAGYHEDLFSLVDLTCVTQEAGQPPKQEQPVRALAHFNGKFWQILPAGLGKLLPNGSYGHEVQLDYAGGLGPTGAVKYVLAGYITDRPLLRRYVPVARWGL